MKNRIRHNHCRNIIKVNSLVIFFFIGLFFSYGKLYAQTSVEKDYVEGKIRIKLKRENSGSDNGRIAVPIDGKTELGIANIDDMSRKNGITTMKRVFPFSVKNEAKHRKYGLDLWYELEFDENVDPLMVVEEYKKLTELDIVKPIYKKTRLDADVVPKVFNTTNTAIEKARTFIGEEDSLILNDPLLEKQWHYYNDGSFGENGYDIELLSAWQETTGSSDVIVSVVDQGVDVFHEDLASNIWQNTQEINGEEGVDDDGNGYIDDFHGYNFAIQGAIVPGSHGTHVAGTIGAVNNNGIGVAGVAGGDGSGNGVRIMSCQVFDDRFHTGQNFAAAIVYGADNGAVISQNSWGYNQANYYEPEVVDAIDYFINEAGQYDGSPMKGGILFFASGNTGTSFIGYPGAFENVIAVTSMGPTGLPSGFSTYGDWTDIAAPGGDSQNFGEEGGILSTIVGDQYGYMDGTSMACPHVSGVAALVVSKFGGADFTAEDLKRIILNSTERLNFIHDGLFGKGYLNANRALIDDDRIPPNKIEDLRASEIFHNEVRLAWTVPEDPDGSDPAYYYFAASSSEITESNFDNASLFVVPNNQEAKETFELRFTGLIKRKDYWFAVKSFDQFDNVSNVSNVLKITTSDEPRFMESTRVVDVTIDTRNNPIATAPITFSNVGEGIIYWGSSVSNEEYFTGPLSKNYNATLANNENETTTAAIEEQSNVSSNSDNALGNVFQNINSENYGVNASVFETDHWKNDITEYVAGLSYENDEPPGLMAGTGNLNAGLIMATRFDIPRDYEFNLTHLEAVLYPEVNQYPIVIEIKKGGRNNFFESETVYQQLYYPDTVEQFKYYRMPLYRPQRFEDGETFWVVLHFPKEMTYPLAMQYAYESRNDFFLMSRDNGRSFITLAESSLTSRPIVAMISAFSTGNDGSYVFLDPTNGEIQQGNSQSAEAIIDAGNLTNGNHLASLGIYTNDVNKPIINIEVKVNVIGQQPEIETTQTQSFDVFVNRENELNLTLSNIGLADLEIFDLTFSSIEGVKNFSNTITIKPDNEGVVPFLFTPNATGVVKSNLVLSTNIGDITIPIDLNSQDEPLQELSVATNNITLAYGTTSMIDLKIKNISSGAALKYDVSHYNEINAQVGVLSQKLGYSALSSSEVGGPLPNQWDDISKFGTEVLGRSSSETIPLGMKFPFYDQLIENVYADNFGQLSLFDYGVVVPLKINQHGVIVRNLIYHNYGDRTVISFDCEVKGSTANGYLAVGEVQYQIVLFRNGTIEYRYANVDFVDSNVDYAVWMRGMSYLDRVDYRVVGEANPKIIENGTVIRFSPTGNIAMVRDAAPSEGAISAGDSTIVKLEIDPATFGMQAGSYINYLVVNSNIFEKKDSIPVTIQVTGDAIIEVQDSLIFENIKIGQTERGYVSITNTGVGQINVTGLAVDGSDFSLDTTTPFLIEGNANVQLPVLFTSVNPAELIGKLSITFEDNSVSETILVGNGIRDAEFVHTINSQYNIALAGGESKNSAFTIENTSAEIDLEYSFTNSAFSLVDTNPTSVGNTEESSSYFNDYSWDFSDSLKVFHKWYDISNDAELLQFENESFQVIKLPFSFPFYGQMYDTIWVSNAGFITVIEPEGFPNSPFIQKDDGVSGVIAPFWASIRPGEDYEGVLYMKKADRFYLQWNAFIGHDPSVSPGSATFQLEIINDGAINFHYKNVEKWGGYVTYGLENPDESKTLSQPSALVVFQTYFNDSSTVAITPTLSGKLAPGNTQSFNLNASAKSIYVPGVYQDSVMLRTNSTAQSTIVAPIELTVTGSSPQIIVDDALVWDEVIFDSGLEINKTISIGNEGYANIVINNISSMGIAGLSFYDMDGNTIIRNSSGELLNPLIIEPWNEKLLEVRIPVAEMVNVEGSFTLSGNISATIIDVFANIVESPVFSWNATNQNFNLNNADAESFNFTVENQGVSTLNYKLIPAVKPESTVPGEVNIVEEIGHYSFDRPITIDSLKVDFKESADGVFTPWTSSANLSFANRFVAPAGGLNLTHVKVYNDLYAIDEYVRLSIYYNGDLPEEGELIYQEKFIIDTPVNEEWMYMPLAKSFFIPEGQVFYIAIAQPLSYTYIGFDVSSEVSILQNCFTGVYQGNDHYYWYPGYTQSELMVWKIRPLTAAGNGQWLELDQSSGELKAGESVEVTATINPKSLVKGSYEAKILASSNDINNRSDEVTVTINVNAAPQFEYYPNIYSDTLRVIETEEMTFNYLFKDPENETITISMESPNEGPKAEFIQISTNVAQLEITTTYDDAGVYSYPVLMSDESGNTVRDTVLIEVIDKNRPPVLNEEYYVIYFNLADSAQAIVIDPIDVFHDPDGDELQVLAGNYTPDLIDLTFGNDFISLIPKTEGVAQIIYGADDGKENGYVLYLSYVVIIDDPDAVQSSTSGFGDDMTEGQINNMAIYPNPIVDNTATLSYNLEEKSDIEFRIADLQGRVLLSKQKSAQLEGSHYELLNLSGFQQGIFTCTLWINGTHIKTLRVIIK